MKQDVQEYIRACESCCAVKNPPVKTKVPLRSQIAQHPFQVVSTDIAGPFPESEGHHYAIIFIDHFTKFCELGPIPDQKAETVARAYIDMWVTRYGTPEKLLSDQGTNYMSQVFSHVNKLLGVKAIRTSPLHPQTNAQAERMWKVTKLCLTHFVYDRQEEWVKYLPFIQFAANHSWQSSINSSPAKLFFW